MMKKLLLSLLALTLFQWSIAQSLSDIQNLKVDNLSDAQIEQLIKRAEASGLNEQQLEAMALERGLPAGEAAKLRQRIMALRSGAQAMEQENDEAGSRGMREVTGLPETEGDPYAALRESDPFYDLTPIQKKIFGFKLFHNRELNFNPSLNIPTPQNYVLGSGDQLLIDVYGASQQSYDVSVSPEGSIIIPNVGLIKVGGSTVGAATSRVKTALSRIYSGLLGANPNTFMELRLGNIRTVSISMVGELRKPGTYTLPSFASPFNALFAAGGPTENGSFRYIQIYRDNQLFEELDVYEFMVNGKQGDLLTLQDNDVIIVPPFRSRVELQGPVRREGLFEMKSGEHLEDLLRFSGGFSSEAFQDRLTVSRKTGKDLKIEDVDSGDYDEFTLQDGDFIRIGKIQNRFSNRVQITGAVERPGTFQLEEAMGLRSLITKAGGLREDAFLNRATLFRTKEDFSLEVLPVDVSGIVGGSLPDIELRKEDVLNIPSIYELREEYFIKISGEVNNPGSYAYAENMTVEDMVVRAGGFLESATPSRVEIARRIRDESANQLAEIIILDIDQDLNVMGQKAQDPLQPFDHVMIRRNPGFQQERLVAVEGEAKYPGEFAIARSNERISDLVRRAGGLTAFAYVKGATLIRRNEFYDQQTDYEIKAENLRDVKAHISRDSLSQSEAEKVLLERIDRKISQRGGGIEGSDKLESNELKRASIEGLAGEDVEDFEIKDTELIGIDLAAILANPGGPEDMILQEGDVLSIPKQLQTVRMRGEVLYPTSTRYRMAKGFKSYISQSGGFSEQARKRGSYVIYANGDVQRTKKILFFNLYPSIEPGAEIIVPRKPDREPLGVQAWVGIASSLATLGILVNQLIQ